MNRRSRGVITTPGATALMRMPRGVLERGGPRQPTTPAFANVYGEMFRARLGPRGGSVDDRPAPVRSIASIRA